MGDAFAMRMSRRLTALSQIIARNDLTYRRHQCKQGYCGNRMLSHLTALKGGCHAELATGYPG